jgi:hypothetical protein
VFPSKFVVDESQLRVISSLMHEDSVTSMSQSAKWFSSKGAYWPGEVRTQIILQNNRRHPVRIIDMTVVKNCDPPLTGTIFSAEGGGEDESIGLGFALDSSDTDAQIAQGIDPSEWQPDYFAHYTISLQPGAQQVLNVFSYTAKAACTFRYRATILDGEKKVYELIGDGTEPFRATVLALPVAGNSAPFSAYKAAYIGGALTPNRAFFGVNPKTYRG